MTPPDPPVNLHGARLRSGDWRWWRGIGLDWEAKLLLVNGQSIVLGDSEADIIQVIMEKNRASTTTLIRRVYGARDDLANEMNSMTVFLKHLREKLEPTALRLINLAGQGGGHEGIYTLEWE